MPEKKVEEKEEKPYPITTSDWVTYLTSKSSNDRSLLFFVGYMAVVVVLGVSDTYKSLNMNVYLIMGVMLILYLLFTKLIGLIQNRMDKYQKLLESIMLGAETNPIDIKEKYKEIEENKRKRKLWKIKKIGR